MSSPEVDVWLWYVDKALDHMSAIVTELGDDLANQRPDLPGANSPYAILPHCCGVMEGWGGEVIANRPIQRDRPAEFRATGKVADLVAKLATSRAQLRRDVVAAQWVSPPAGPVDDDDAVTPLGQTQGGVLLHIYEELAQHLGQLELTRDLLRRGG
jgi:Protein of unknown function (DUF664)